MIAQGRWRTVGYAVLWLGVGLLLAALLSVPVLVSQIRQTQLEGTPTGRKLLASSDRVLDCTDPKGKCFKRGQRQTGKAVSDITAANLLAVVCALDVPDGTPTRTALHLVTDCVTARLSATH